MMIWIEFFVYVSTVASFYFSCLSGAEIQDARYKFSKIGAIRSPCAGVGYGILGVREYVRGYV